VILHALTSIETGATDTADSFRIGCLSAGRWLGDEKVGLARGVHLIDRQLEARDATTWASMPTSFAVTSTFRREFARLEKDAAAR